MLVDGVKEKWIFCLTSIFLYAAVVECRLSACTWLVWPSHKPPFQGLKQRNVTQCLPRQPARNALNDQRLGFPKPVRAGVAAARFADTLGTAFVGPSSHPPSFIHAFPVPHRPPRQVSQLTSQPTCLARGGWQAGRQAGVNESITMRTVTTTTLDLTSFLTYTKAGGDGGRTGPSVVAAWLCVRGSE